MRRFILTYEHKSNSMWIEGVQFSSGKIILEHHPYGGVAWFRSISRMEDELNAVGKASIKWLDEVEAPASEQVDSLSKSEVTSVLNRLSHYYYGRMRASRKMVVENVDRQSSFQYALSASQWEAKRDAVFKVAENLEIELKEHEE